MNSFGMALASISAHCNYCYCTLLLSVLSTSKKTVSLSPMVHKSPTYPIQYLWTKLYFGLLLRSPWPVTSSKMSSKMDVMMADH